MLHDIQYRAPLVRDERLALQGAGQEFYRLLDFIEAALAEPLLIQRVAPEEVLPQSLGGPDSEPGALLGLHAVAN